MAKENELTWMVVEDDHAIREIIQIMCELWQYDLLAFKDGWEAMAYLNKEETPGPLPQIALLDIRMPGPWGHEISARIRKHDTLKDIGIILMTAYDLPGSEEAEYLRSSGADKLIYKPLPPMDVLLETVREVLARRASDRITAGTVAKAASPDAPKPETVPTAEKVAAEKPASEAHVPEAPPLVTAPPAEAKDTDKAAPPARPELLSKPALMPVAVPPAVVPPAAAPQPATTLQTTAVTQPAAPPPASPQPAAPALPPANATREPAAASPAPEAGAPPGEKPAAAEKPVPPGGPGKED
ncbi:MAG: response regulator [Anaerolineae bacterium]|nr:response regulator [Anaerolineae bacterium]